MTSTLWSNIVRGVALGDGWGDLHEFASIDTITKNDPMGPEIPKRLRITDDTQMTLYLATALTETWGEDMAAVKAAIAEAFLIYRDDPDNNRAPGITVMSSLGRLSRDGSNWQRATSATSDGSGTVMRTSPTAFLQDDRWVGITAFAAAITHGASNAIAAAILNAAVLRDLMRGSVKPGGVVRHAYQLALYAEANGLLEIGDWLEDFMDADRLYEGFAELARMLKLALDELPALQENPWALDSDPSLQPSTRKAVGRGGGWRSHQTLVIALLALDMFPGDGLQAVRRAVMTDGDSDTIGAVAGGLVGAAYPGLFLDNWTEGLGLRERLEARYVRWIEVEADAAPFENPPVITFRTAHFKTQPHGKGNLLRKVIFVAPTWVRRLVK